METITNRILSINSSGSSQRVGPVLMSLAHEVVTAHAVDENCVLSVDSCGDDSVSFHG